MDFLTIRTRLRKRVGNPSVTDVPDADLNDAINSAYSDIAVKYKFFKVRRVCTFNTVVGQAKYMLPSGCFAVLRIRDNTNKKWLAKGGDRDYAARTDDTSGKPERYVRYRDWLALMPPSDGVYELEMYYKAKPADLSLDADEPLIPEPWQEGLVRLAKYYYFEDKGDLPKAESALRVYDKWAEEMPLEFDDEAESIDSGVELPTLSETQDKRLDFDHAD